MGVAGALFAHKIGYPRAGHLHGAALDPVPADGGGRRARQSARRALRRRLRGDAAGADLRRPGLGAGLGRPGRSASSARAAGEAVALAVDRFVKQPALEPGIFGLILVLFILFEPLGIYGRWLKISSTSRCSRSTSAPRSGARRPTCARSACGELLRGGGPRHQLRRRPGARRRELRGGAGHVFTIIGPNGAGKTTIFNVISRIYAPTSRPAELPRRGHHARAAARDRAARDRADLPEHRAVRARHGAAEPAARPPRPPALALRRGAALPAAGARARGGAPGGGREGDRLPGSACRTATA